MHSPTLGPFGPIPGMAVIGLGHRARHGKDSFARAIMKQYPQAQRFAFADDLYAVARVHYGMTVKDAPLLQKIGLEYRENPQFGVDVWVRAVYSKMLFEHPALAIVTDVRFRNEFDFIKALGGTTVRVTRFDEHGHVFVDPSRPATHISETALTHAPWDITVENRDLVGLETQALLIAEHVIDAHTVRELAEPVRACWQELR